MALCLADGMIAEVEDGGGEHGRGPAIADAFDEVVQGAHAAGSDHWHRYRVRYGAGERDIEARAGAIAVHRGEKDFASAEADHLARILDCVDARAVAAAMRKNLPAGLAFPLPAHALGVDGDDYALITE